MDYYVEKIAEIKELILKENYSEAERIIKNELAMPYVPRDYENEFRKLLADVKELTFVPQRLSDEQIEKYLSGNQLQQLRAVEELNNRNLREFLPLCEHYLSDCDYPNSRALLIDSLIRQQISHVFTCVLGDERISFDPSLMVPVESSAIYAECLKRLQEFYLKEPSKQIMASQLLYKELLLSLPIIPQEKDLESIVNKICEYIDSAFA